MARNEALLLATRHRFRPIVMTAMTTIFGMVPLTFATYLKSIGSFIEGIVGVNLLAFISASDMGRSFESFGFMIIGGMASATLFTLLAVPVFYSLIDDAQKALQNTLATVLGRSPKPSAAE